MQANTVQHISTQVLNEQTTVTQTDGACGDVMQEFPVPTRKNALQSKKQRTHAGANIAACNHTEPQRCVALEAVCKEQHADC